MHNGFDRFYFRGNINRHWGMSSTLLKTLAGRPDTAQIGVLSYLCLRYAPVNHFFISYGRIVGKFGIFHIRRRLILTSLVGSAKTF